MIQSKIDKQQQLRVTRQEAKDKELLARTLEFQSQLEEEQEKAGARKGWFYRTKQTARQTTDMPARRQPTAVEQATADMQSLLLDAEETYFTPPTSPTPPTEQPAPSTSSTTQPTAVCSSSNCNRALNDGDRFANGKLKKQCSVCRMSKRQSYTRRAQQPAHP